MDYSYYRQQVQHRKILGKKAFPHRGKVPNGRKGEYKCEPTHIFIFPLPSFGHLPPVGEGLLAQEPGGRRAIVKNMIGQQHDPATEKLLDLEKLYTENKISMV
jgi:hypothetical protein